MSRTDVCSLIVGDSNIGRLVTGNLNKICLRGNKLGQIHRYTVGLLRNTQKSSESLPCIIYVYGGFCDLVTKLPSKELIVEEFSLESLHNAALKFKSDCSDFNVRVVFCTINPCDLMTVNSRPGIKKQYSEFYAEMQSSLLSRVKEWNNFLLSVNMQSGLVTPFFASWVLKVKKSLVYPNYHLLHDDGVYPSNVLLVHWQEHLQKTHEKNMNFL